MESAPLRLGRRPAEAEEAFSSDKANRAKPLRWKRVVSERRWARGGGLPFDIPTSDGNTPSNCNTAVPYRGVLECKHCSHGHNLSRLLSSWSIKFWHFLCQSCKMIVFLSCSIIMFINYHMLEYLYLYY